MGDSSWNDFVKMIALAVLASSVAEVHIVPSFVEVHIAAADTVHSSVVEIVGFVPAEGLDKQNYFGSLELMPLEPVVDLTFQC